MTGSLGHAAGRPWTRLIIADPGLIDSIGHHLGYSAAVATAARAAGLPAEVLAGRAFVPTAETGAIRPVFGSHYQSATQASRLRGALYGWSSHLPAGLARGIAQALRWGRRLARRSSAGGQGADGFGAELAAALSAIPDAPGALVLLHSVSAANLAGLPDALPATALGGLAVVLRRTPDEMDTTDAARVPIAVVLAHLRRHLGGRLRLFADTEDLSEIYRALLGQPVTTVPLPVVTPPMREAPAAGVPTLVFAGGAREEKGYALLPDLARALGDAVRLVIHSGRVTDNADPLVQRAHRALRALANPPPELIERSLSPDEYMALIGSADLLLLPYRAEAYGPRSSGILAEARAMGVPAVVPAETWMAREVGAEPRLVFAGAADLGRAVRFALDHLPAISRRYRDSAATWRDAHNPDALFRALAGWSPDRD